MGWITRIELVILASQTRVLPLNDTHHGNLRLISSVLRNAYLVIAFSFLGIAINYLVVAAAFIRHLVDIREGSRHIAHGGCRFFGGIKWLRHIFGFDWNGAESGGRTRSFRFTKSVSYRQDFSCKVEPPAGIEPATACLQNRCSTAELWGHNRFGRPALRPMSNLTSVESTTDCLRDSVAVYAAWWRTHPVTYQKVDSWKQNVFCPPLWIG